MKTEDMINEDWALGFERASFVAMAYVKQVCSDAIAHELDNHMKSALYEATRFKKELY